MGYYKDLYDKLFEGGSYSLSALEVRAIINELYKYDRISIPRIINEKIFLHRFRYDTPFHL